MLRYKRPKAWQFSFALVLLAGLIAPAIAQDSNAGDPPDRVGRVSKVEGPVSLRTQSDGDWDDASINFPVATGYSLYTAPGAKARFEIDRARISLDAATEVDVVALDDQSFQINLPQGSANVLVRSISGDETYWVATPSGTIQLQTPGRYHIDAGNGGDTPAAIAVISGQASLLTDADPVVFVTGQSGPVAANEAQPAPLPVVLTDIDIWSAKLDAPAPRRVDISPYISPDVPGAEELAISGNWEQTPEYGAVWYPPVPVDYVPYRNGHWGYVGAWGWTWIDDAPWGFAATHYGRFVRIHGRWAVVPGAITPRPVYVPAAVAFVGGAGWNVGVTVGGGAPAVGWIPLGPREVYVPPYHVSEAYVRNVNITHVTDVTVINNVYVEHRENRVITNYANVQAATVVSANAMTNSRPVRAAVIEVKPAELAQAPVHANTVPVKPSLDTKGATQKEVKAVGGDLKPVDHPKPAAMPAPKATPAHFATPLPGPKAVPATPKGNRPPPAPAAEVHAKPGTVAVPPAPVKPGQTPPAPAKPGDVPPKPNAPGNAGPKAEPPKGEPPKPGLPPKPEPSVKPTPNAATPPKSEARPEAPEPPAPVMAPKPEAPKPLPPKPETAKPDTAKPEAPKPPAPAVAPKAEPSKPMSLRPETAHPEPAKPQPGVAPKPGPGAKPEGEKPAPKPPEAAPRTEPPKPAHPAAETELGKPRPETHPNAQKPEHEPRAEPGHEHERPNAEKKKCDPDKEKCPA